MTVTTGRLALAAALLQVAGTVAALAAGRPAFAAGFAASAGLVLLHLALLRASVARMLSGDGRGTAVFTVLRHAAVLVGLFALVRLFPPAAVLLGSSVVVAAVLGLAVVGGLVGLEIREGC